MGSHRGDEGPDSFLMQHEAILKLKDENERLRKALTEIMEVVDWHEVTTIAINALDGGDDG